MGWLDQPIDRLRDVIEGTYPPSPVTGRSIAASTFKATRTHGDLRAPSFPGAHFHRGFAVVVLESGGVAGDPPNAHGGSVRRAAVVRLDVGYLYARDAAERAAGAGNALWSPTLAAHDDAETIETALVYPAFWGGTTPTLVRVAALDRARTVELIANDRIVCERRYEILVSYAPGTVHP